MLAGTLTGTTSFGLETKMSVFETNYEYVKKYLLSTVKYGGSSSLWTCFSFNGYGCLDKAYERMNQLKHCFKIQSLVDFAS